MGQQGEYRRTEVTYSNYNNAFFYFFDKYKQVCLEISETLNLRKIRSQVSAFLYEFSYTIPSKNKWYYYEDRLTKINEELSSDTEFNKVMSSKELSFYDELEAYPKYYHYFVSYLNLLSDFVSELTSTYMPRTTLQKKLLRFSNHQPFYEKYHEFKSLIFDELSNFSIDKFRTNFNKFITYCYAYKLFINEQSTSTIQKGLSLAISLFLNDTTIKIIGAYPDVSSKELDYLYSVESILQNIILRCNKEINISHSDYGITPKLTKKIYTDRWQI